MAKYYEEFKALIIAAWLTGYYMSSIELIFGKKWYLRLLKCSFYFMAISAPLYFVFSVNYLILDDDEGEVTPKTYAITLTIYCAFITYLTYSFYLNIEKFVKLFELWDSMFEEELFPEDRQVLLDKNIKTTNRWLKIFGGVSLLTSIGYNSATYFNKDKKLDHPIGISYKNETPDFEILNTYDLLCSLVGFATFITYDSMTMAFFCLEDAQFKHLKNSLAKIIDIFSVTDHGEVLFNYQKDVYHTEGGEERLKRSYAEVEEKLKIWISHHNQVLRFHEKLQRMYHVPLSLKFSAFAVICCLSAFLLAMGSLPMKENILAIAFCFNNYSIFYVNITFADSIKATSESIFGQVFGKSWYLYPKNFKTAFRIILMRSHRPAKYVTVWIYPIDSRTFLKILTSIYSLATFLLQVNRKSN